MIANVYDYSGFTPPKHVIGEYETNQLVEQSTTNADPVQGHMEDVVMAVMVAISTQHIMEENSFREVDSRENLETNDIGIEVPCSRGANVVEKNPILCFSSDLVPEYKGRQTGVTAWIQNGGSSSLPAANL